MLRILCWLLLTLLSAAALGSWFLQQQYEARSADYRILYREITVKLSQHDAIIPLLPASQHVADVQHILPQIVRWRQHEQTENRAPIVAAGGGRYWLNSAHLSILIDLPILLETLGEKKTFAHLAITEQATTLFSQGNADTWWRWDKSVASPTQPFVVSAGDNPQWAALPWWLIVSPALFWALVIGLLIQFQTNKRRRDSAALRARYNELIRLNTLGELAAGMMHELNQPLAAIMNYNNAALRLIKQDNPAQVPTLLDAAIAQIKRIDALLSQFRQKLTAEHPEYQPIDLQQLWLRVCKLLDNELDAGKVRVSSAIASDLPPFMAPPLWIEQILHNMVSNAVQAQTGNPYSAWIHLEVRQEKQNLVLTLTDGGTGLSPEALKQVFMPFFTTRAAGLGLGMALTDTLVQRLHGTIEACNVAGAGACFTLHFPPQREEAQ
jgi:signal transduction histidine kinase